MTPLPPTDGQPGDMANMREGAPLRNPPITGQSRVGAEVTTRDLETGEVVGTAHCAPDDYVIVTGPDAYIAHTTVHGNGTHVVTIKKEQAR